MLQTTLTIIAGILSLVAMDSVWLGYIMKSTYQNEIGNLMKSPVELFPAFFVYLFISIAIYLFILPKAGNSLSQAALWGSAFGFLCYGVYDMTNLAVLKNWTLKISVLDILWGAVVCGLCSTVMFLVFRSLQQ